MLFYLTKSIDFRYDFNGTQDFSIPYPTLNATTSTDHKGQSILIGVEVHSLNIVQNLDAINISAVHTKIPRKPRQQYYILCEEPMLEPADEKFTKVFDHFWKKYVLNVAIIYWNQTVTGVTFTPFKIPKLIFIQGDELKNIKKVFKMKTNDLNGYPLNVTIFYDESRARFNQKNVTDINALAGPDGLLGHLIVKRMNATLRMTVPEDNQEIGELFENGTASGCLGALMSGVADIGFNIRFYRLNQFEGRVEATIVNGRDDICFLVPRKGKQTDIANIFRPFDQYAWLAIVLSIPCYAAIFYLFLWQDKRKRSVLYYFMQFFAYALQQQITFFTRSKIQQFLLGIWILSVLMISSMYQSKLSGTLIIPKDAPNYETFEQLAKSDLKILSFERYNRQIAEFLRDEKYQGAYESLIQNLVNVSLIEFYKRLDELNSSLGFINKYHINVYEKRKLMKDNEFFFHQMKKCPVPYLAVYGVRYGTPFKSRINFIIRQAQESGLIELWDRELEVKEQMTQAKLHNGHGICAFNLLHLQSAFFVYCMGCFLGMVSFICEHLWHFKTHKYFMRRSGPFN